MSYLRTKGIVIKEVSTGEADRIITIFTKEQGKISAHAKGARRSRSKISAGTQLLCYGDFILFKGKELYSVNSCEMLETFYEIRNDVIKLTYTAHMIEIVNDIVQEGQQSSKVLQLFLNSLHMLAKTDKDPELIIRIFEIRLLSIIGYAPYTRGCIICGREELNNIMFSFKKCGFICNEDKCLTNDQFALEISSGAAKAIYFIVNARIQGVFSFNLSEGVLKELERVSKRYLRERLEKDYKKLDFLKNL